MYSSISYYMRKNKSLGVFLFALNYIEFEYRWIHVQQSSIERFLKRWGVEGYKERMLRNKVEI